LPQALQNQDATVLVTAHPTIDHTTIAKQTPLFIDLRGITQRAARARADAREPATAPRTMAESAARATNGHAHARVMDRANTVSELAAVFSD
ncbi:MAG TPA: hypothetical protein VKV27_11465, partial [Solirubrobacteraceae bacterium]|nr:hypothetical protein [Solirubrobacteraceae bacterium]